MAAFDCKSNSCWYKNKNSVLTSGSVGMLGSRLVDEYSGGEKGARCGLCLNIGFISSGVEK